MHGSVYDWFDRNLHREDVEGKSVLEAGSCDVNGSVRPRTESFNPESYLGVDAYEGKRVDAVVNFETPNLHFSRTRVLISTEMLEHAFDWQTVIFNMKDCLHRGGLLFLTTRSFGMPYHPYPVDYWRFSIEDIKAIFSDFEILNIEEDKELPGVFLKARKPLDWTELYEIDLDLLHEMEMYRMPESL